MQSSSRALISAQLLGASALAMLAMGSAKGSAACSCSAADIEPDFQAPRIAKEHGAPTLPLPPNLPRRGCRALLRDARKDFERELAQARIGNRARRRHVARQLRFAVSRFEIA